MSKKKVLICAATVPFVSGGAELLVRGLVREVRSAGFKVEVVSIPYQWDPPVKVLESCLLWRLLRPNESPAGRIDLVVATKFPTYAVEHPNKVGWILHQHRGAYDLKDTIYDDFTRYENADYYRRAIRDIDRRFMGECRSVFTISKRVSGRIRDYCRIESEPIYHPPPFDGRYHSGDYGDYVLVVGRLDPLKRVDLVIRAMKSVKNKRASLKVVGQGFLRESLEELASREGISDSVSFEGFVSEEELLDLYANAGCVVYVPFEEDYGYSTLEAFKSRRPVVVTDDSGGTLEFVVEGENGMVVPARPENLAGAIDELLSNKRKAKRLGNAGFEAVAGISWKHVIDKLIIPFVD
ncbi:MAG: glycosyltransferase family 4 protein [Actinomycetia bacterium]|nr:glycosyltransferase family 4 protein [Actinomycetes bacterium]